MGTRGRKIVLWCLALVAATPLLIGSLAFVFREQLKKYALASVEGSLHTAVSINKISISPWRHLPYIGVNLDEIVVESVLPTHPRLFSAGRLSVAFNPLSLLFGHYSIDRISIDSAEIFLVRDFWERTNWDFLSETNSSNDEAEADFAIALSRLHITNSHIQYSDGAADFFAEYDISDANLSGVFTGTETTVQMELNGICQKMKTDNVSLINGPLDIDLDGTISTGGTQLTFSNCALRAGDANFAVSGQINLLGTNRGTLNIDVKPSKISVLENLIPHHYYVKSAGMSYQGIAGGKVVISGEFSGKDAPTVDGAIEVKKGGFQTADLPKKIDRVSFKAKFHVPSNLKYATVNANQIQAQYFGSQQTGTFTLRNFDRPYIQISYSGTLKGTAIAELASIKTEASEGAVTLKLTAQGNLDDFADLKFSRLKLQGTAIAAGLGWNAAGQMPEISNLDAELAFSGQELTITSLSAESGPSDIQANGRLFGLLDFLEDNHNILRGNLAVSSKMLDLDELLPSSNDHISSNGSNFTIPTNVDLALTMQASRLLKDKIDLQNILANCEINKGSLMVKKMNADAFGGAISLSGAASDLGAGIAVAGEIKAVSVDVPDMLKAFDNFGQAEITDKHLKGYLTADTKFSFSLQPDGNINLRSLKATADLTLKKGQLIGFEPLKETGKFVKTGSLDNIEFEKIETRIVIKNESVQFAPTEVKSSATNCTISGEHGFDNSLNYHVRLNASQLVMGKRKNHDSEFGIVEVDERQGLKVSVHVTGTADNPKVSYDKAAGEQQLKNNVSAEVNSIKEIVVPNLKPATSLTQRKEGETPGRKPYWKKKAEEGGGYELE